jgi:hypothetical protein
VDSDSDFAPGAWVPEPKKRKRTRVATSSRRKAPKRGDILTATDNYSSNRLRSASIT